MGRIVLEVSNEELLQLGEEKIKEEIERSLKFLKNKGSVERYLFCHKRVKDRL